MQLQQCNQVPKDQYKKMGISLLILKIVWITNTAHLTHHLFLEAIYFVFRIVFFICVASK